MKKINKFYIIISTVLFLTTGPVSLYADNTTDNKTAIDNVTEVEREKRTKPISEYEDVKAFIKEISDRNKLDNVTIKKAFDNTTFDYSVIELMDKPAEKRSWEYYHENLVSKTRIDNGKKYMTTHKNSLDNASEVYGVDPSLISAIIGIESSYGEVPLKRTSLQSLATLAFEYPRRAAYFKSELESLFVFADKQKADPESYRGSYAGAIGIPQFMPSNISKYGRDGNGDGNIDIVTSHSDAIASVANYIKEHGWKTGKNTSALVTVNDNISENHYSTTPCDTKKAKTVKAWKAAGVTVSEIYGDNETAVLSKLANEDEEDTFTSVLFFENACPIFKYNRSVKYTAAISLLAEALKDNKSSAK